MLWKNKTREQYSEKQGQKVTTNQRPTLRRNTVRKQQTSQRIKFRKNKARKFRNTWHKRKIPQEISQPQINCKCFKLDWNGGDLTLDLRLTNLKSEDPKVQKWSNKAQNIAWKSANLNQIKMFD